MKFPPDGHPYFKPPYEKRDESSLCWTMFAIIAPFVIVALMWCPWWQEIFKTWPVR